MSAVSSTIVTSMPKRRGLEPREVAFRRAQAVFTVAQMEQRAVIDDLALVIAPDGIRHSPDAYLVHVARHQPVDIGQRLGTGKRGFDIGVRSSNTAVLFRIAQHSEFVIVERVGGRIALPAVPLVKAVNLGKS
ncbi:MAG: hypothetical protein U5K38_12730 [Woeseiaceae bacterium]|nr:hypothetical protein [Woeseiaceae bacterium]